ncbi:hypothetical protein I4F81_011512 [Pyropia yezoensis]|uniref:Uncharacterized protein n=1 Tax=Pyropia yezoensis TaxID=2788 RepID=A0ACC3CGG5_PYRYE|nr:hypothetical protein I4F81_011512 [Neopyropia yezoensis]
MRAGAVGTPAAGGAVGRPAPPGAAAAYAPATVAARSTPPAKAGTRAGCRDALDKLLDEDSTTVSTVWDPQQFEPAAATPCTVYPEGAVVKALGRTLSFANGKASCCASAYFNSVLRPLSWMQAAGRPRGDLCIPDAYWETLGWHVANFATGMHKRALGEEGTYGLPSCRFPDRLLESLTEEQQNWACVYAPMAGVLGAGDGTRFVLPAYTNAVSPETIPGREVVADLRQCPGTPAAGFPSRVALLDGTSQRSWMDQEDGGSSSTAVDLSTPTASGAGGGTKRSRWDKQSGSSISKEERARLHKEAAEKKRTLAPSPRRCGLCPVRYTAINDRWCCARYCDWYSDSMALAVTSRQPSQLGCCVKMNKRCITSK